MWKNERAVPNISALQRLVTFLWFLFDSRTVPCIQTVHERTGFRDVSEVCVVRFIGKII
jgi:hypothetical protein